MLETRREPVLDAVIPSSIIPSKNFPCYARNAGVFHASILCTLAFSIQLEVIALLQILDKTINIGDVLPKQPLLLP